MTVKKYRTDIMGLRALATLLMVLEHIYPDVLLGSALAVSIFFVLSGFLTTNNFLKEYKNTNQISISSFYKKRLFRVIPPMAGIIVLVLFISPFFIYFDEVATIAKSAAYSILGSSNIYFWAFRDVSYFAKDIQLSPLLHFWSLGLEEQFYFILPLLLSFGLVHRKALINILIFTSIASIIFASLMIKNYHMFTYYMLPSRIFELFAGVLVALYMNSDNYKTFSYSTNQIITFISLLTIILVNIFLPISQYVPSAISLLVIVPCCILLLNKDKNTISHKILSNRIFDFIGIYSFSIYLIHWPLLVFFKFALGVNLSLMVKTIVFVLTIILAIPYYHLVENKFRTKDWSFKKGFIIFVMIPFILSVCVFFIATKMNYKYAKLKPQKSLYPVTKKHCHYDLGSTIKDVLDVPCIFNGDKLPNILMIGDSHSIAYASVIKNIAEKVGFSFRGITLSGCSLFVPRNRDYMNSSESSKKRKPLCEESQDGIYDLMKKNDIIIIGNKWLNRIFSNKIIEDALIDLSKSAKLILIVGTIPIMDNLDLNSIINPFSVVNLNRNDMNGKKNINVFKINEELKEIVKKYPKARYIDFNDILCDKNTNKCKYNDGINSLYGDITHLSIYGFDWLGKKYLERKTLDKVWYEIKDLYKEKGTPLKENEYIRVK